MSGTSSVPSSAASSAIERSTGADVSMVWHGETGLPAGLSESEYAILDVVYEVAAEVGTNTAAVALAWLLKHPSKIVPIVGSTNPERIRSATKALDVNLSREEWYRLLTAARSTPLP